MTTTTNKDNHASKNIPSYIFYPIVALGSILFYLLVICGDEVFFELSSLLGADSVSGSAMDMFAIISAVVLVCASIACAVKFSSRVTTSQLIIGMILAFLVYILAPFVYRTSGNGWIDLGPTIDMILLIFIFWFQPGLFFIVSFVKKRLDKKNKK